MPFLWGRGVDLDSWLHPARRPQRRNSITNGETSNGYKYRAAFAAYVNRAYGLILETEIRQFRYTLELL